MTLLNRHDVELHYEVSGEGPPVLFIQGVGVAGSGWEAQTSVLAAEFQTLRFDNRGLGRSVRIQGPVSIEAMADDASALLNAVGWESAHIVGHSMGGVIAQQLALNQPERVRSLALLCTFARGKQAARLSPKIVWLGLRTRLGTRRMRRRAMLELVYPADFLKRANRDELAESCGQRFGRDLADSPPIVMKQLNATGRHDVSARLGELAAIPAMVLSAERDPIALPEFGRDLARRLGNASFEVIPGASHAVVLQEPGVVNDRLRRFWWQVERERVGRVAD